MTLTLHILNILFFVFHTALVLFNVFGWMWKRWRPWNLACILATAFSWCVMGIWKGVGYCICTDYHWQVREALGYRISDNYIQMVIEDVSGATISSEVLNPMIKWTFIGCAALSIGLNLRDVARRRRSNLTPAH